MTHLTTAILFCHVLGIIFCSQEARQQSFLQNPVAVLRWPAEQEQPAPIPIPLLTPSRACGARAGNTAFAVVPGAGFDQLHFSCPAWHSLVNSRRVPRAGTQALPPRRGGGFAAPENWQVWGFISAVDTNPVLHIKLSTFKKRGRELETTWAPAAGRLGTGLPQIPRAPTPRSPRRQRAPPRSDRELFAPQRQALAAPQTPHREQKKKWGWGSGPSGASGDAEELLSGSERVGSWWRARRVPVPRRCQLHLPGLGPQGGKGACGPRPPAVPAALARTFSCAVLSAAASMGRLRPQVSAARGGRGESGGGRALRELWGVLRPGQAGLWGGWGSRAGRDAGLGLAQHPGGATRGQPGHAGQQSRPLAPPRCCDSVRPTHAG